MDKTFYTYMLANQRNGTLYIGVTNDLVRRVHEHRSEMIPGFSRKYGVKQLVYYEVHTSAEAAITREKQLKKWKRRWKLRIIEEQNPDWNDLYQSII